MSVYRLEPLKFEPTGNCWKARTPIGDYTIYQLDDEWRWRLDSGYTGPGQADSYDDAISKAWSHYSAAMLPALSPIPVPPEVSEAKERRERVKAGELNSEVYGSDPEHLHTWVIRDLQLLADWAAGVIGG